MSVHWLLTLYLIIIKDAFLFVDAVSDVEDNTSSFRSSASRKKRQVDEDVNKIQVLMVVDYAVYTWFYNLTELPGATQQERAIATEQNITRYYALVFNRTNARYEGIADPAVRIQLELAGLIIAKKYPNTEDNTCHLVSCHMYCRMESDGKETSTSDYNENATTAFWTEERRVDPEEGSLRGMVPASEVLESFQGWVNDTALPPFDHIVLFTGYNLTYGGSAYYTGLSYPESICTYSPISVVEDTYDSRTIGVLSQEIGRSLGARLDLDGNFCLSTMLFIMTPHFRFPDEQRVSNLWKFSSCSINYFKDFISDLQQNCLLDSFGSQVPESLAEYLQVLPGDTYGADDQCRLTNGKGSYVCRAVITDYRSICRGLPCFIPETGTCQILLPADGTLCGNKAKCNQGVCEADETAKTAPDNCVFGDQPSLPFGETCGQIDVQPFHCYRESLEKACCGKCNLIRTQFEDCQFRDRIGNCREADCLTKSHECCYFCKSLENNATKDLNTRFTSDMYTTTTTDPHTTANTNLHTTSTMDLYTTTTIDLHTTTDLDTYTTTNSDSDTAIATDLHIREGSTIKFPSKETSTITPGEPTDTSTGECTSTKLDASITLPTMTTAGTPMMVTPTPILATSAPTMTMITPASIMTTPTMTATTPTMTTYFTVTKTTPQLTSLTPKMITATSVSAKGTHLPNKTAKSTRTMVTRKTTPTFTISPTTTARPLPNCTTMFYLLDNDLGPSSSSEEVDIYLYDWSWAEFLYCYVMRSRLRSSGTRRRRPSIITRRYLRHNSTSRSWESRRLNRGRERMDLDD